jgi:hypothetical protein
MQKNHFFARKKDFFTRKKKSFLQEKMQTLVYCNYSLQVQRGKVEK